MTDTEGFWAALKRRRVFRAAAAYVAIAFATLEGADLVLPRLGLPDAILTVLVILAVIGFPVTLALSWVFDFTAEGLARTAAPAGAQARDADGAVPGTRRPLQIAVLVAATLAFGAAAWWWIPRAPAFRPVDVDPDAIAVLPFEVRGSDDVAYLREGMLDLLGTKLDGVGGIRVIDPHTTLAALRDEDWSSPSVDEIRRAAADLGAGRALQGSVVQSGDALQIRATAYGTGDDSRVEASVEGPSDELFGLVDRLATELVAGGMIVGDTPLIGLEALTTDSNEALRDYLEAVAEYRTGTARAETHERLLRAVALDTTFALAAFWAGELENWFDLPGAPEHFALADRHADRLSPRDRMRVSAALAASEGRYADAIPLYAALVERYPEDLLGWFRYAEELAHQGRWVGKDLAEARRAYERAFALDPAMAPLYFHMAHIGGLQGDSLALRRWAAGLDSMGVDPLWPAVLRINEGLLTGDSALVAASYDRYRQTEGEIPAAVLGGSLGELVSGPMSWNPSGAGAILDAFRTGALTDTARTVTARRAARLEAGLGRFEWAEEVLGDAAASLGTLLPQDLAWLALHPARGSGEAAARAFDRLSAATPAPASGEAAARHYLLARLALALDRPVAYRSERAALASLSSSSADPEVAQFAEDLGHEVSALATAANGTPEAGLDSLLAASYWRQSTAWLGFAPDTYFGGRLPDRDPMFLRAELLRAAGRDVEAATWYRVAADGPWHQAVALRALAELAVDAGAAERAAGLYDRVLGLWSGADPVLIDEVERIRRLAETPG